MPTIDDLPAAVSVSDRDELMVSQSDIARKATRAQLLAGVQAALAMPANTLLGRVSAGTGAPETITIGANLTVAGGAISAPPPFLIDALPEGGAPMLTDQVPIGQGGQNGAISYGSFIAGVSALPGLDASNFLVTAVGSDQARTLSESLADAVRVESFGAAGDGVTDDTAAFVQAAASGRPLALAGRVYVVNGAISFAATQAVVGVAGATVLRRTQIVAASGWIEVLAPTFEAHGILFDAGGLPGIDMPAVTVAESCQAARFAGCGFINATGGTAGCGLSVAGASAATLAVEDCRFTMNGLHGLWVSGSGGVSVVNALAQGNAGCGVRVEPGIDCHLGDLDCSDNDIGVSVGDWSTAASAADGPPDCAITDTRCVGNGRWGIAVSGNGAQICGNSVQGNGSAGQGGGILARLGASRLAGNIAVGGPCGLDVRGCWGSLVSANHVSDAMVGMIVGGSQYMTVTDNTLLTNGWGMVMSAIEPSLSYQPSGPITVRNNWIGFTTAQGGGIYVQDGAQGVAILGNDLNGWGSAAVSQALWLHTDAAVVRGNRWNNQARLSLQAWPVAGLETLVVPDVVDEALVTAAPGPIASVLTSHQANMLGQVSFIKVAAGGAGYSHAEVVVSGSGTGAAAVAYVTGGQVVWIAMTNSGSGYGPIGNGVSVTIEGDGTGAAAVGYVGLPVLDGRGLRLHCNCQMTLALSGSSPQQQSWTGFASTVPAFAAVDLQGVSGAWRAETFPPVDYLTPTGDGGAIVQSVSGGSLILRPATGGALTFASAAEPAGCTSTVGRGSPLGSVAAPPGSDFRNLDGGPGNTFWIKQANTDATGWLAIA